MRRLSLSFVLAFVITVQASDIAAQQAVAQRTPRSGGIPGTELVIVATDFQFQVPPQVDAGLVNIRLFNRGKEMHHVLVIKVDRMDRLAQIADELKANRYMNAWMHPLGGPESVGPGGVSSASMVLEPGRYVLACIVASPTTHRQHFMDGMLRELSVVKAPGPEVRATLPPAELSLSMKEWSFTLTGALHAGRRTIRVENDGTIEHHLSIVRLIGGATALQAAHWMENPQGPPPFEPVGGTTGLGPKAAVNVTVDLMPGEYAFLCTLYNPLAKKTHSAMGMVNSYTVTS
ncbi:MAG: hypothetical protein U0163_10580 [Gemmatimonadaceae bacterium]